MDTFIWADSLKFFCGCDMYDLASFIERSKIHAYIAAKHTQEDIVTLS